MRFHVADQPAEHLNTACASDKLRVENEVDHASLDGKGVKLIFPDLVHLIRGLESVAFRGGIGVEIIGGVVEDRVFWKFDERDGLSVDLVEKRTVAVTPVTAVNIAVLKEEAQAVIVDDSTGCAMTGDFLTGQIFSLRCIVASSCS